MTKLSCTIQMDHLSNYGVLGRYGVSVPALHKRPRWNKVQYAVSRRTPYAVFITMIKVINEEFEKLESPKIGDDLFSCNTSLEIFHKEFNQMSGMDDNLFTYEVEIPGLTSTRGDDEVELTNEESPDSNAEDEVAEILRIDTNVFDFETPTCKAFKEFNYLLQIDPDFLTMEQGRNLLLLNTVVNHSYSRMDIRNGQLLAGKMMDIGMDHTLKDEALKNKAIMEGVIEEDDESYYNGWRRWDCYENDIHDHEEKENEEEHENKERCKLFDNPHHDAPDFQYGDFAGKEIDKAGEVSII
ncbi:hypothetical protein Tco_0402090 [Tanacetum coccineum]